MSANQPDPAGTCDVAGIRHSRRQTRHRGRLRQGRRRQVHDLVQSRARLCRHRAESQHRRCRSSGPSQPKLFGLRGKPRQVGPRMLEPLERYGVKVMSIGFLVEEDLAMVWRGAMVISAITQLLREVAWGDLDILVIDLPPGTGDAQLTMAQQAPLAGAVIVSTPQDIALIDARRGIAMFEKVNIPILGLIENMSAFCCPACQKLTPIFGHGGARQEAERRGIPFLGEIPARYHYSPDLRRRPPGSRDRT